MKAFFEGVGADDTAGVWEGSPNLRPDYRAANLKRLEKKARAADTPQLGLFDAPSTVEPESVRPPSHPAIDALAELDPDALTPREALEKLYALAELVRQNQG